MARPPLEDEPGDKRREAGYLKQFSRAESVASIFRALFKWGGLAWIATQAAEAIRYLAGEATTADIGVDVNLIAGFRLSTLIAWAVAVVAVGYGLLQRKLRRNSIERLQRRIQALEQNRDPRRSSSGLTPRGETRPEDKL